ncbi:hypothetical protein [Schaalia sp. ZJ405]|nr:hypothetical protein [Schaalia sp. ZJ405]
MKLRNRLILEARGAGVSWNDIARAAGMSRQTAQNIGQKEQKK